MVQAMILVIEFMRRMELVNDAIDKLLHKLRISCPSLCKMSFND